MKFKVLTAILICLFAPALLAKAPPGRTNVPPPLPPLPQLVKPEPNVTGKLPYLIFLPARYQMRRQHLPLLVFLHGASDVGTNIDKLKDEILKLMPSVPGVSSAVPEQRFILLAPQSPDPQWDLEALNTLLDGVIRRYHVDENRVYLTGVSLGGGATWALAAAYPEKFAAIVPVGGSGDPADAKKLVGIPVWAFHGAKDATVPLELDKKMVDAVKAAGGTVDFTIYDDAGHDIGNKAYSDPKLFSWLFQQKRQQIENHN